MQSEKIHTIPFGKGIVLLLALVSCCAAQAQQPLSRTLLPLQQPDTLLRTVSQAWKLAVSQQKNNISRQLSDSALNSRLQLTRRQLMAPPRQALHTLKTIFSSKPHFSTGKGFVSWQTDYRTYLDTPVTASAVLQHSLNGSASFTLFHQLPFRLNFLFRRTNSALFTRINDVQLVFDGAAYRNLLQASYRQQLEQLRMPAADSLLELSYKNKLNELAQLKQQLNNPLNAQQLVAAHEILKIPALTQGIAPARADSLKASAHRFIQWYEAQHRLIDSLQRKTDTLQQLYQHARTGWQAYKSQLQQKILQPGFVKRAGRQRDSLTTRYNKLFAIRSFGLGRSFVNYSELTVKNISLNGITVEYNPRYYFAVAAGMIDFRFRDFIATRLNRTPQHLVALRAGIGRPETNFLIATVYRGEKQIFLATGNIAKPGLVTVYGMSLEGRYWFADRNYIVAEVAQSSVPAILRTGNASKPFLPLSDKTNKAVSVKLVSYIKRTTTSIEGLYRYTGASFQSFSSYQTNASLRSWYLRVEQPLFRRVLRITASLRSNEFTNPFIAQRYKANTVFKTFNLAFRKKKWPVLTAGYVPVTQLTMVGDQLTENQFHTLNASASHSYKVSHVRASTSLVYSRFFNDAADSSLLYYNAQHLFINHILFFTKFSAQVSVSHSRNTGFELNTLEESLQWQVRKWGMASFGVRISNLNRSVTKLGASGSLRCTIPLAGVLHVSYDNNYLPGTGNILVRNEMMQVGLTKTF